MCENLPYTELFWSNWQWRQRNYLRTSIEQRVSLLYCLQNNNRL
jgi:hypothetical protein